MISFFFSNGTNIIPPFFLKISTWLVETIKSANGDVVLATRAIAKELGMKNDFPVFMAVMDLAWFRPDLVDPASKVRYLVKKIVLTYCETKIF